MKLVGALAVAAGASAFNVNDFVGNVKNKIFKQNKNGFSISLEPYFSMDCKEQKKLGSDGSLVVFKSSCSGTYGADKGGSNPFTRKTIYNAKKGVFKYAGHDEGNTQNWVGVEYYLPNYANEPFWIDETLSVNFGDFFSATLDYSRQEGFSKWGGNDVSSSKAPLALKSKMKVKEGGLENGAYNLVLAHNGVMVVPKDFDQELNIFGFQSNKWKHVYKISADQACTAGPHVDGCEISASISGKTGKTKLNHSVNFASSGGNSFEFIIDSPQGTCTTKLELGQNAIKLTWAQNNEAPELVLQILNPMGPQLGALTGEVGDFFAPFKNYWLQAYAADKETFNGVAHAAAWVDRRMAKFTDEFDCSDVFAATLFESESIAKAAQLGMSVQEYVQGMCAAANDMAVEFMKTQAAPAIAGARDYVFKLTDPAVGGEYYNSIYGL